MDEVFTRQAGLPAGSRQQPVDCEDGRSCQNQGEALIIEEEENFRPTDADSHHGNELRESKEICHIRIACGNVQTLPVSHKNSRNSAISSYCNKYNIDLLGMNELNRYWKKLQAEDHLHNRFEGTWEDMHCIVGYNVTDENWDSDFQIGGTAQISINQAAHRVVSSGQDPSNLGRWVWTRMIGKGGLHFRVVTLY